MRCIGDLVNRLPVPESVADRGRRAHTEITEAGEGTENGCWGARGGEMVDEYGAHLPVMHSWPASVFPPFSMRSPASVISVRTRSPTIRELIHWESQSMTRSTSPTGQRYREIVPSIRIRTLTGERDLAVGIVACVQTHGTIDHRGGKFLPERAHEDAVQRMASDSLTMG